MGRIVILARRSNSSERWLQYRDNRNNTAHDYGINFTEETLVLLPQFIIDLKEMVAAIKQQTNADKKSGNCLKSNLHTQDS